MKFIDEVTNYLEENPRDVWEIPFALGCAMADTEVHDERRWSIVHHTVFQKKTLLKDAESGKLVGEENEYVLVEHHTAATELQEDIEDEYPPTCYAVEPYETVAIRYRPI